jgi:hypothetical protein
MTCHSEKVGKVIGFGKDDMLHVIYNRRQGQPILFVRVPIDDEQIAFQPTTQLRGVVGNLDGERFIELGEEFRCEFVLFILDLFGGDGLERKAIDDEPRVFALLA